MLSADIPHADLKRARRLDRDDMEIKDRVPLVATSNDIKHKPDVCFGGLDSFLSGVGSNGVGSNADSWSLHSDNSDCSENESVTYDDDSVLTEELFGDDQDTVAAKQNKDNDQPVFNGSYRLLDFALLKEMMEMRC